MQLDLLGIVESSFSASSELSLFIVQELMSICLSVYLSICLSVFLSYCRVAATELDSDLLVKVADMSFHLHKVQ
jgi:hypothetical protein